MFSHNPIHTCILYCMRPFFYFEKYYISVLKYILHYFVLTQNFFFSCVIHDMYLFFSETNLNWIRLFIIFLLETFSAIAYHFTSKNRGIVNEKSDLNKKKPIWQFCEPIIVILFNKQARKFWFLATLLRKLIRDLIKF